MPEVCDWVWMFSRVAQRENLKSKEGEKDPKFSFIKEDLTYVKST
jgi:hypothetical protein